MKERYLNLMKKTLSAYSEEQIIEYYNDVKENGLKEHGFPRLTADIGILISKGYRKDLYNIFVDMMDLCCERIPITEKAANDFSVREIVACILELEGSGEISNEKLESWKEQLNTIDPRSCYNVTAKTPSDKVFNWALFSTVSEHMRGLICNVDTLSFVDVQIPTQLQWLDENGMYRDDRNHAPMVYDIVPRVLFTMLLHYGYKGKYRDTIDTILKKTELMTLKMQSVTGELPYGGRSNQFLHNEAWLTVILENGASRYKAMGDLVLASKFKAAAKKALDNIEYWLSMTPIHHVKNRFPLESKFGCDQYGYFNKYMITTASILHDAYTLCNDDIVPSDFDVSPSVFMTSRHFNKLFMRAGGYSIEFDLDSDLTHDNDGLGRLHKLDSPSTICLSMPCTSTPKYISDRKNGNDLSIAVGKRIGDTLVFALNHNAEYKVEEYFCGEDSAAAKIRCGFYDGCEVVTDYHLSKNGLSITLKGDGEIALLLPAFSFDGNNHTVIKASENELSVSYLGHSCRYVTSGTISKKDGISCNRNGYYESYVAVGKDLLTVNIEIK